MFDILNPIELNVVAGNFTTVSYQAGTIVFESMALMPDLYIVYEGELCCEVESNKFQREFFDQVRQCAKGSKAKTLLDHILVQLALHGSKSC